MRVEPFHLYILYEQRKDGGFDPQHIIPLFMMEKKREWLCLIVTDNHKVFLTGELPHNFHDYDEFEEAGEHDEIYDYTVEASEKQLQEFVKNKDDIKEMFDKLFNEIPKYY